MNLDSDDLPLRTPSIARSENAGQVVGAEVAPSIALFSRPNAVRADL